MRRQCAVLDDVTLAGVFACSTVCCDWLGRGSCSSLTGTEIRVFYWNHSSRLLSSPLLRHLFSSSLMPFQTPPSCNLDLRGLISLGFQPKNTLLEYSGLRGSPGTDSVKNKSLLSLQGGPRWAATGQISPCRAPASHRSTATSKTRRGASRCTHVETSAP